MDDLDEQLEALGYGNIWTPQIEGLAMRRPVSDIGRIKQHNKRFPELHKAAKRRWAQNRSAAVKDRAGKEKCLRCFKVMNRNDLIGENRLHGHCKKCRKELLD